MCVSMLFLPCWVYYQVGLVVNVYICVFVIFSFLVLFVVERSGKMRGAYRK
jgi:hypothetical protein